jgi:hypothetical protein
MLIPPTRYESSLNSPTAIMLAPEVNGSGARQVQVVHPCLVRLSMRSPLATASSPSGTVIAKSYLALSLG